MAIDRQSSCSMNNSYVFLLVVQFAILKVTESCEATVFDGQPIVICTLEGNSSLTSVFLIAIKNVTHPEEEPKYSCTWTKDQYSCRGDPAIKLVSSTINRNSLSLQIPKNIVTLYFKCSTDSSHVPCHFQDINIDSLNASSDIPVRPCPSQSPSAPCTKEKGGESILQLVILGVVVTILGILLFAFACLAAVCLCKCIKCQKAKKLLHPRQAFPLLPSNGRVQEDQTSSV